MSTMGLEEAKEHYRADFERFERGALRNGGSWSRPLRKAAISHFAQTGLPTARDEDWKYTSVAPIARVRFTHAPVVSESDAPVAVEKFVSGEPTKNRLVFLNGRYVERLSSVSSVMEGVEACSLSKAITEFPALVEKHLARYASYRDHAFLALNTAFMQDGAFVYVPQGRVVEEPIHLLFISAAGGEPAVAHPRNVIVVDRNSEVKIVESYVGSDGDVYFTNGVTEVVASENAVVDHCKLAREGDGAFHVATLQVHLGRNGNFVSHSMTLSGSLTRNEINVALDGEGGNCTLNGLYLGTAGQHIDNHTKIEHLKPHGVSREVYKGILEGKAHGVFNGKIVVHKDAQKTDAKQTNKNLLLSEQAAVDTKPQLEIFNNDVKCSHGSTIGRLDEDAIFYLRSRGIDLQGARGLLTYAFAGELVSQIKIAPVRAEIDRLLRMKFQKKADAEENS